MQGSDQRDGPRQPRHATAISLHRLQFSLLRKQCMDALLEILFKKLMIAVGKELRISSVIVKYFGSFGRLTGHPGTKDEAENAPVSDHEIVAQGFWCRIPDSRERSHMADDILRRR